MIKKILAEVGPREAAVIAGAALVTTGLALVCVPAAFVAPGSLLLWLGLR